MRKARSETPSVVHKIISRRMFCETGMAALSAQLLPGKAFGFACGQRSNAVGCFRATDAGRIGNRLAGLRPACADAFAA